MSFCTECGRPLSGNEKYCNNCGTPVLKSQNTTNSQNPIMPQNRSDITMPGITMSDTTKPGTTAPDQTTEVSPGKKVFAIVMLVISALYSFVIPADFAPDFVPILGWMDDLGLLGFSVLNAIQTFMQDQQASTIKILKLLKWIALGLFVIVILLVGGLIAFIISLFK